MMHKPVAFPSRRDFLGASAAAAVCSIVPRHVLGGPKFVAPSDKVNVAVVGAGGQGRTNIRALFQEADAQVIAVADPIAESNLEPFYHHRDWLDACKGAQPASSNFEYGAQLTELVLLGVLSLRARRRIYWDAANMKARNLPEADALIHGTYRDGWKIA